MSRPKVRFEIDRAKNKELFARIVIRNGKQTWTSGETYQRKQGVERAIKGLVDALHGLDYEIIDLVK